ncbi:unnamed protein product, partial [Sphagnum compactum]
MGCGQKEGTMSTRSAIAICDKDFATTGNFKGNYHHWDGYPSGLGRTLWEIFQGTHYLGQKFTTTKERLNYLIKAHPAGFSSINDVHEYKAANALDVKEAIAEYLGRGHRDIAFANERYVVGKCKHCWNKQMPSDEAERKAIYKAYNEHNYCRGNGEAECHCHGEWGGSVRDEKKYVITQKNASYSGCEWVYAIDPATMKMYVMSSVNEDGSKMIGMFGSGNPDAQWKPVGVVDLNDPAEPDWDRVQYGASLDVYNQYRAMPHHVECMENASDEDAYCPKGHPFYKGRRYPGDVCEGRS